MVSPVFHVCLSTTLLSPSVIISSGFLFSIFLARIVFNGMFSGSYGVSISPLTSSTSNSPHGSGILKVIVSSVDVVGIDARLFISSSSSVMIGL